MNKKTTGVVAYITLIGLVIALAAGDRENAKFHLNQAIVLTLSNMVMGFVVGIVSSVLMGMELFFIGGLIMTAYYIGAFALWLIGIINAATEKENPLPFIGGIRIIK